MQVHEKSQNNLYSLIPLEDFKTVLGIDDRDERIAKFCLVTATHSIEQFCKRRLLRKKHFENLPFWGDCSLTLAHYPVLEILAIYIRQRGQVEMMILEPEMYMVVPDCGSGENWPFTLSLSPGLRIERGEYSVKAVYKAGYASGKAPPDLASACLELAAWNMARYKGRKIGTTGIIRGSGRDGEHFEMSMPENVKALLEPYRRKVI